MKTNPRPSYVARLKTHRHGLPIRAKLRYFDVFEVRDGCEDYMFSVQEGADLVNRIARRGIPQTDAEQLAASMT